MERKIDLYRYDGIGLIVACSSGVFYTSQTKGLACDHPREEGVFVPFPDLSSDAPKALLRRFQEHFKGGWHHLLESDADFIDAELGSLGLDMVEVDRSRLHESFEAWVCVRVKKDAHSRGHDMLSGFDGLSGVLTWPNSD